MNELRMLNRIQDKLFIEDIPAKVEEDTPTISVTTRSNIRRVRFADRPHEVPRNIVDETGGNRGVDETTSSVSRKKDGDNEFEAKPRKSKVRRALSKTTITSKRVTPPKADDIDPLMVQAERRERISTAQNEETKWADLKKFFRGEFGELTHKEINNAGKVADRFVLSEDGVLYYEGRRREKKELLVRDLRLRLVVPTTLINIILLNCHDSIEGGHQGIVRTYHRVKADYYWIGLYADVVKHVQACEDCSTSKSKPQLKGYSPGNVISERPFQVVSMDFVIPLPQTRRGNTA